MNLQVLGTAKVCVWWQLTAKIWAAKGVEAKRTRQAETERQTDRRSDRDECQSQLRCRLDVCRPSTDPCSHCGVCVCTGPCHWGCLLQALRRPNALRQFCLDKDCRVKATGSLPSDTLIEGENELVRFSVAGDEGEESKGEKEERRGAG